MNEFSKLGINTEILKAIEQERFEKPTEIQEKSIPVILEGKDVIAGSKTGSGKTLAFACGIIENSEKGKGIQSIVLTPTRELCIQVSEEITKYSRYKHLKVTSVYGGVSINPQIDDLQVSEVMVGTPGRVLDHLQRGTIDLSKVKVAVLDEADRMLDMGFIDDVRNILSQCSRDRQTLLYSATISTDLYGLAKQYMKNPVKISVESKVDPRKLKQAYYQVPQNMKFSLLVHLLRKKRTGLVMVFCNTQRITNVVAKNLQRNGIKANAIHGGLSQAKRTRTLESFHKGKAYVLVCTDVAARGLHIEGVTHIYNYDIPKEPKQYIHRIGRTARAGKEGIAVSLLTDRDFEEFDKVLHYNNLNVPKLDLPYIERVKFFTDDRRGPRRSGFSRNKPYERRDNSGFKPRRQSGPRNDSRSHSGPKSYSKPGRSNPRSRRKVSSWDRG